MNTEAESCRPRCGNSANSDRDSVSSSVDTHATLPRILISVTEAAQALGVSRSYAYQLVTTGFLDSVRLGRRVLVPVSAIEELVARERAGF